MKLTVAFIVALISCFSILDSARASILKLDGGRVAQVRISKNRVRREVRPVTFEVDDEEYHFNFERTERQVYARDIPVYLVKSKPGSTPNYTYERVPDTEKVLSDGFIYVDNTKRAVTYVHYNENNSNIIYDGVFGENKNLHLIKSLLENQKNKLQRTRQRGNHVIYKAPRSKPYQLSADEEKKRRKRSDDDLLEEQIEKPFDVLHPKLLVLVDNALWKYHNSDIPTLLRYLAIFWNSVDQKFIELDTTNVQLLVTGVIIADDEDAFNYVKMGKLDPVKYGEGRWHIPEIFEYMRMYFHHNFTKDVDFQNYDAAVLMTALETRPVAGATMLGKICGDWYNDIIIRDQGWYDGVHVATHELTHALGVDHDSYKETAECSVYSEKNGKNGISIMSPNVDEGDYYFWSECTKRALQKFTTTRASECLGTRHRERKYADDNPW